MGGATPALMAELTKTIHDELSRAVSLPEGQGEGWEQLSECARERWIRLSTAAFLAFARVGAAGGTVHGPCVSLDACESRHARPVFGKELTARERVILEALSNRATIRQIAVREYISLNTVKTHVRNIYRKLGISSRAEAAVAARALEIAERMPSAESTVDRGGRDGGSLRVRAG